MPIYEYQCQKCQHQLEALQKISDKPLRECPECGKHTLKRLVSAPMFRLSGSGWYETDFKSDNERKRNLTGKDESPPAESTADKSDTKAEAKPEAKPDVKAGDDSGKKTESAKTSTAKPAAKGKSAAKRPAAKKSTRKR